MSPKPYTGELFPPHQAARFAVQGWLASRLVLLITVLILIWTQKWRVIEPFSHWDAVHFMLIARRGYTLVTEAAFFPGLPMLMAAFKFIGIPFVVTGVLLSLVGSGMSAWALYRLAGGSIRGAVAVLAWSFAPMAVFTFVPYTESIFCAFALWAFWFAKRNRWAWAGALAGAACLFRVSGLFLIGALGLIALVGIANSTWKKRMLRIAWLGIPMAVLAAYMVFLRVRFGSWTVWFEAQIKGWGRSFHWPWEAFVTTMQAAGWFGSTPQVSSIMFSWEMVAFAVGIAVTVWCFVRKKIPEGGWVGIQVLALSCQVWFISMTRSVLLWFPLFLWVSAASMRTLPRWKNDLRRGLLITLLGLEMLCMIWWADRFFCGAWAG